MSGSTAVPENGARLVEEQRLPGSVPLYVQPLWAEWFPWLAQGTTGRGTATAPFDLGLFGAVPVGESLKRWRHLRGATACPRAVHARQVHGARLTVHDAAPPGLFVGDGHDGHVTSAVGVLLTVSVADCVPISIVDPERRAVALLHGGWRGVASGILENGVGELRGRFGSAPADLHVHLGPAICGACYEVGPEVHDALGLPVPQGNSPVDLRSALAARAAALGVSGERITRSAYCTRCGEGRPFFSHRGGSAERQMGVLGVRADR